VNNTIRTSLDDEYRLVGTHFNFNDHDTSLTIFHTGLQIELDHGQNNLSDMSFHGPYAMAIGCVCACVPLFSRRLFALGVSANIDISCAGNKLCLPSFAHV